VTSEEMKEYYKEQREILEDLMIEYDVPKRYWHNANWLNSNIDKFIPIDFSDFGKFIKALHIMNKNLTRLWSVDYE
jgi:hypothetical protein